MMHTVIEPWLEDAPEAADTAAPISPPDSHRLSRMHGFAFSIALSIALWIGVALVSLSLYGNARQADRPHPVRPSVSIGMSARS